jgi:hypothetical protein
MIWLLMLLLLLLLFGGGGGGACSLTLRWQQLHHPSWQRMGGQMCQMGRHHHGRRPAPGSPDRYLVLARCVATAFDHHRQTAMRTHHTECYYGCGWRSWD